jgi:hypothetical protein
VRSEKAHQYDRMHNTLGTYNSAGGNPGYPYILIITLRGIYHEMLITFGLVRNIEI